MEDRTGVECAEYLVAQRWQAYGPARCQLVTLGRYAMKGIARPQELFTLDSD